MPSVLGAERPERRRRVASEFFALRRGEGVDCARTEQSRQMLSLEVRKKTGGAEVHRVSEGAATVGASSGNEVVVRARGVAGRHVRIFEKDGQYQLDLYRGVDAVSVNGRAFLGGRILPGDRITIGEATITLLNQRVPVRPSAVHEIRVTAPGAVESPAPAAAPPTEVEYRALRMEAYALCRQHASVEALATELADFLDREFEPSEWSAGEFSPSSGFRPLASTFLENPALPPRVLEDIRAGERVVRADTVTGLLTLVVEPANGAAGCFAILVRETPRLPARAILFLEELVQLAGIAARAGAGAPAAEPAPRGIPVELQMHLATSLAETVLRETDDLKKIVETVEREVIDRAMRRVEGNQSRASEILNISRGSLIAKLKEFRIPDYRYLRRERAKHG